MKNVPKILIIGHARHGKDEVCKILREKHGFKFLSSSRFCSKRFIFDSLREKYRYNTEHECYEDRHSHRGEWFNLIHEYCADDLSKLGKEIFAEYDIYCGLRNRLEFESMKQDGIFDFVVWVDRSNHLPPESDDSMTLDATVADYIIDNNGDLSELHDNVDKMIEFLEISSR
jgi:dephospho-CoA kinase